ncbi:MAG: riboflavin biosynthesis protein RibF [Candidatus Omnitrophica bacterium]|nr:riboflavin biosynthesis protein RibF [Candidatus Omnitrophota bacterium]
MRPVVAIGIFDGVHRGHQAILARAVRRAQVLNATPIALTFWPHPAVVVAPWRVPPMLLSLDQRKAAFAACGIARTVVLRFTRAVARQTPEQFVGGVLARRLRAREVVVGHDFRFGHGRAGTIDTLRMLARRHGIRVHVVPPVRIDGVRVSSRIIRRAIQLGRLATVRRYLGRPPTVVGCVVRGAGRGQRVGIPTANVAVAAGVLPPPGVYAVRARTRSDPVRWWGGVANLGWRPTVERRHPTTPTLEVHVLRPRVPSLRGRMLEVAFVRRLRAERRFPSVAALVAQIHRDIAASRRWLGRNRG